jgi:hypothetical protein
MMSDAEKDVFVIGEFVHTENFKYVGVAETVKPKERYGIFSLLLID